ncbi:MFS transporter [Streptomyces sp. NPDC051453]|uniref:MFS transporter n=1 Tax=Streptomyces sp. NPDC051453 TaxID=3154941 RepID=UPI00343F61E6
MDRSPYAVTGVPPTTAAAVSARLDRLPVMAPHIVWISILTVNLSFEYYDNALFAYILPAIMANSGLSLDQTGMVSSAFFVGMILGALFGGRLSDRLGRRRVLTWATVVYSLGALLTSVSNDYDLMLVSRVITGIGVQAATSALLAYIAEMFPSKSRGRFVSVVTGAFVIVAPLVGALAFYLVPGGGPDMWRHLFAVGGAGLLVAPLCRLLLPESVRWYASRGQIDKGEEIVRGLEARALRRGPLPEPQLIETGARRLGLRDIFGNRRMLFTVLVLSAGYFGSTLGLYLYQNWSTYVLVDGLGYSESTAYGIIMTWSIVYAVTPFLALVLMDRIERKTLVLSMSVISALPILVLGLSANSTVVLVAGGAAGIVTGIVLTVYYAYIPETIPTEARGLGSGIIISIGRVGGAASGVLGAALYAGWGRAGLMAVAAASYVVFSIVVLLFGPRTTNRPLEGVTADDLSAAK